MKALADVSYSSVLCKPQKVMIVEDDPEHATLIKTNLLLEDPDLKIDTFCSGEEAVERLKTTIYDMIIIDYYLVGMTGIEVLKEIKSRGL